MGVSALNQSQTVKISSKRQITIPSKFYEAGGLMNTLCVLGPKMVSYFSR